MPSSQVGWRDAAIQVLRDSPNGMSYTQIADEIIARGLRSKIGATPAASVNTALSLSIKDLGEQSPFERIDWGRYRLRLKATGEIATASPQLPTQSLKEQELAEKKESTGLINALGMYWSREKVLWTAPKPKLLGRQNPASEPVDFYDQRGVYLLHDRNAVIYVGRAIDHGIGSRLREHTTNRLNSRWDRFSWFGVLGVSDKGELTEESKEYDRALLIATMEALLIESVEPTQNRKRGDDFGAAEFLQADDPEVMDIKMKAYLQQKLGV